MDPHASEYDRHLMTEGWFVPTMPDLNMANIYMANYMIQNSIWWTEYVGLAGIRMDTYPYPDKDAMAEWNRRLLKEYPHLNIVGEEWSLDPAIVSYWQRGQQNHDGYDGAIPSMLDFPLQNAVQRSLMEEEQWNSGWVHLYETVASDFLYPEADNLVVFPDNHDMPRFFMQLDMDVDLYKMGIAYFLTTRGIPQIFYGSEILMTHTEGDDHGRIRKDFPGGWAGDRVNAFTGEGLSDRQLEIQDFFKSLLLWRKHTPVIHTGQLTHFAPVEGTYTYFRHHTDDAIMVVLNKNDQETTLDLDRFDEILKPYSIGTNILDNMHYDLSKQLTIGPKRALILQLK
jgi:glycosidase